jgi:hypothetical protein
MAFILERFKDPAFYAKPPSGDTRPAQPEKRWIDGLYLDQPEGMDDPYRFFRW